MKFQHILVVDDDKRLRSLLKKYLSDNGFVITTAANASEAREWLAKLEFDMLIVDVMMPEENGLSLTSSLRKNNDVPILMLTAMVETKDRIAGLEHGADDYLTKPFEPRELLLRINSILRRVPKEQSNSKKELKFGTCSYNTDRNELSRNGQIVKLTPAEAILLKVLVENKKHTLSREELASRTDSGQNLRTIDVQVTRLRKKIEDDPRLPRHIQTIRGKGYMLVSD
ncbi:MAG: response regulator transcription factor [Alphaproteobacteria bacterium]|nr:response regulator transcription factor [Alphaproteobacteria bacterium]